jgi:hypothetical protein
MATEIQGSVLSGLMTKLDTLELTEDEHTALAVLLAAGVEAGREAPEVQGFTPPTFHIAPLGSFGAQFGNDEVEEFQLTFSKITIGGTGGGTSISDDWTG